MVCSQRVDALEHHYSAQASYTPDQITTSKYLDDKPCTFLSDETPGNIGTWIGWQIVSSYMKENNASLQTLMQQQNAQEFLSQAKYKP